MEIANKSLYAVTRKLEESLNSEKEKNQALQHEMKEYVNPTFLNIHPILTTKSFFFFLKINRTKLKLSEADENAASANDKRLDELATKIENANGDDDVLEFDEHEELLLRMVHKTALMISACQTSIDTHGSEFGEDIPSDYDSDTSVDISRRRGSHAAFRASRRYRRRVKTLGEQDYSDDDDDDSDTDQENLIHRRNVPRVRPSLVKAFQPPPPRLGHNMEEDGNDEREDEGMQNQSQVSKAYYSHRRRTSAVLSNPVLHHRVIGLLRELHKHIHSLASSSSSSTLSSLSSSAKVSPAPTVVADSPLTATTTVPSMKAPAATTPTAQLLSPSAKSAPNMLERKGLGLVLELKEEPGAMAEETPLSPSRRANEADSVFKSLCRVLGISMRDVQDFLDSHEDSHSFSSRLSVVSPSSRTSTTAASSSASNARSKSKRSSTASTQYSSVSDATARLTPQLSTADEGDKRTQDSLERQIQKGAVITNASLHMHKLRNLGMSMSGLGMFSNAVTSNPTSPSSQSSIAHSFKTQKFLSTQSQRKESFPLPLQYTHPNGAASDPSIHPDMSTTSNLSRTFSSSAFSIFNPKAPGPKVVTRPNVKTIGDEVD